VPSRTPVPEQRERDALVRPGATAAFVERVRGTGTGTGTTVTYDRIPGATHATVALRSLRSLFDRLHAVGVSGTAATG